MKKLLALSLATLALLFCCAPASAQVNPSYLNFNTNHFTTNGSPWKIAIKTNQNLTVQNFTVVSNAFFGNIFYATNIVNFLSNINVAVSVHVSNSVHVTSNIFLGGTNIVELFGLWRTNIGGGGITNYILGTYPAVWTPASDIWVGGTNGGAAIALKDEDGTAWFAYNNFRVIADGSIAGNELDAFNGLEGFFLSGFDGSAHFGAATTSTYPSNYLTVAVQPMIGTASPEFEIDYSLGWTRFIEDKVRIITGGTVYARKYVNNSSSQNLTNDSQVVGISDFADEWDRFGYVRLSSDSVTASDRNPVLTTAIDGQLAFIVFDDHDTGATEIIDGQANQDGGTVVLRNGNWTPAENDSLLLIGRGDDWVELSRTPGAATVSPQVLIYTTTDPNTDMVEPDDPTSPAIAYKDDGQGPIWYWDIGDTVWR